MIHRSSIFSFESARSLRWREARFDRVVVAFIMFCLLAEGGLRAVAAVYPSRLGSLLEIVNEGYHPPPHVFDAKLGYRYQPNAHSVLVRQDFSNVVETNSDGYRDTEFRVPTRSGVTRVAVLGDSFVAGNQVQINELWASLLEQDQAALDLPPVEVLNFGVDGYRIWNQLGLLDEILPRFRPDLVLYSGLRMSPVIRTYRRKYEDQVLLIADTIEGLDDAAIQAEERIRDAYRYLPDLLMRYSLLARLAIRASGRVPIDGIPSLVVHRSQPTTIDTTPEQALRVVAQKCRDHGARLAVILRDPPSTEMLAFLEQLTPLFVAEADFLPAGYAGMRWPNDAHFTSTGHRQFALRFAPYFRSFLKAVNHDR